MTRTLRVPLPSRSAFWVAFTKTFWSHYVSHEVSPLTSPFQREHSGRGPQLPQQPGWGHAFPMLPSANDSAQQGTGAGPLPPNMEPLKRTILTRAPYGQLKFSQSCPIVFLSNPPSFSLSFPRCQTCVMSWGSCSLPLLLLSSIFHKHFPQ